jgi:hypothetical protein
VPTRPAILSLSSSWPEAPEVQLVTHADGPFGGRIAARLLCGGDAVRAQVSARSPSRQVNKLRTSGAEVICSDLGSGTGETELRLWRGVTGVVHAPLSTTAAGKEAVVSLRDPALPDPEDEAFVCAATGRVRQLVLLSAAASAATQSLLERSGLAYTLLHPCAPEPETRLGGGARGRLLERRRQILFLPLQQVADIAVFAALVGFKHALLELPSVVRRYGSVAAQVEKLLRLPHSPLADTLLAELITGSPYKLVTPGVARVLGLTFAGNYLEQVFAQPFDA